MNFRVCIKLYICGAYCVQFHGLWQGFEIWVHTLTTRNGLSILSAKNITQSNKFILLCEHKIIFASYKWVSFPSQAQKTQKTKLRCIRKGNTHEDQSIGRCTVCVCVDAVSITSWKHFLIKFFSFSLHVGVLLIVQFDHLYLKCSVIIYK